MSSALLRVISLLMGLLALLDIAQTSKCPQPSKLIAPCHCASDFIDCFNLESEFQLREIFSRLRRYVEDNKLGHTYEEFRLRDSKMTQLGLKGDIFDSIRFRKIHIQQNHNLKAIKASAFESSYNTTEVIEIEQNPHLSSHQKDCIKMFEGFSRFSHLTTLRITESGLRMIPSKAFSRRQPYLSSVILSENRIESIGGNAFSALESLQLVNMDNNRISRFDVNAFNLTKGENNTQRALQVLIRDNELQTSTFRTGVFSSLKTSIHLILDSNNITKLPYNIFSPFFKSGSSLSLKMNLLDCDCDFKWLLDQQLLFNSTREGTPYALRYYNCRIEDQQISEVDWQDFAHCPNCLQGDQEPNLCNSKYYVEHRSGGSNLVNLAYLQVLSNLLFISLYRFFSNL